MVIESQIEFPPYPFTAEDIAECANRLETALCARIQRASDTCPLVFQKPFIKLCYLILINKPETSPTAREWVDETVKQHGHFAELAFEVIAGIRQRLDQFFQHFEESDQIRLRPEMLGTISAWADKNGSY